MGFIGDDDFIVKQLCFCILNCKHMEFDFVENS